jgi:beta-galactosidase
VMGLVVAKAKLKTTKLPEHIRLRKRGNLMFAFNYGTKSWKVPTGKKLVLGLAVLKPQAIAAWVVT